MDHRQITLEDGHRVGIIELGPDYGVPLVFFHGFTANSRLYRVMLERLAARGYRVTAIDMAGHGLTDTLPLGHTFADMADLAVRALDHLGINRAVVAGHSLGGRMTVELAARHPHRVDHAVLMNAAVGDTFDELGPTAGYIARLPLGIVGAAADLLGDVPWNSPRRTARYLRHLASQWTLTPVGVVKVALATMAPRPKTVDLLADLARHGVPTTVIHSAGDQIVPYANGKQAAQIADGRLVTVRGFHNWVMVHPHRAADKFADALRATVAA